MKEIYTIFTGFRSLWLLLFTLMVQWSCINSTAGHTTLGLMQETEGNIQQASVIPGAEQLGLYVPMLKGKRVALVANHSSLVGDKHLLDTLLALDMDIRKIFVPEHGFRGDEADGAIINTETDQRTGVRIETLYGQKRKKPGAEQLADVDVIVFDLQDVGVRFYTYLSTLHYIMESAAENGKSVIVLDRPNPNGYYIDGPVLKLEKAFVSFIGLHPVPIVYGMTIGEYARMINGEKWLANGVQCVLEIIPLTHYNRNMAYRLPVPPSPNLHSPEAVLLYPSLALLEGTTVSLGRGTDHPFQCLGHPEYQSGSFSFTPEPRKSSTSPKWKGQVCHGADLRGLPFEEIAGWKKINLSFLTGMYDALHEKTSFFREDGYFTKLAGTDELEIALKMGWTEQQIRASWQPALQEFKTIRSRYLLYPDMTTNE